MAFPMTAVFPWMDKLPPVKPRLKWEWVMDTDPIYGDLMPVRKVICTNWMVMPNHQQKKLHFDLFYYNQKLARKGLAGLKLFKDN